jgi:hypothetical protein
VVFITQPRNASKYGLKFSFCNSRSSIYNQTTKSLTLAHTIRVFIPSSSTHYKRGTQLSVSLLQHLPKVRLHYREVCVKVLQGYHLEVVEVVDERLAAHGGVSSLW